MRIGAHVIERAPPHVGEVLDVAFGHRVARAGAIGIDQLLALVDDRDLFAHRRQPEVELQVGCLAEPDFDAGALGGLEALERRRDLVGAADAQVRHEKAAIGAGGHGLTGPRRHVEHRHRDAGQRRAVFGGHDFAGDAAGGELPCGRRRQAEGENGGQEREEREAPRQRADRHLCLLGRLDREQVATVRSGAAWRRQREPGWHRLEHRVMISEFRGGYNI